MNERAQFCGHVFGKSIMNGSIKTSWFTQQKQWDLYSNKVTSSLAATQNQVAKLTNVKWSIILNTYIFYICVTIDFTVFK